MKQYYTYLPLYIDTCVHLYLYSTPRVCVTCYNALLCAHGRVRVVNVRRSVGRSVGVYVVCVCAVCVQLPFAFIGTGWHQVDGDLITGRSQRKPGDFLPTFLRRRK